VRYIANRSSGKQGHAIAEALRDLGCDVTLVTGPVALADPAGVTVVHVQSARDMLVGCERALPADILVCAAAVADWRTAEVAPEKMKKDGLGKPPALALAENPDILKTLSRLPAGRPHLVVGFAAETENVIDNAKAKLAKKGCDWIVANDVSPETGTFGGDANTVHLVRPDSVETWPCMPKSAVAGELAQRIARHFAGGGGGLSGEAGQAAE
ncbi:MAG: phosphopantothenoylcysteine decarboxylase, partial [Rhodospirillaceae bacterium]